MFNANRDAKQSYTVPVFNNEIVCQDLTQVKSLLADMRKSDDNCLYVLNRSGLSEDKHLGPEDRTDCVAFWKELVLLQAFRKNFIETCIKVNEEKLEKNQVAGVKKSLARRHISLLQSELEVEDILGRRTKSLFRAKCPNIPADW